MVNGAVALAALAGCSFHAPGYDGTHYQCGAGGTCPTGQTCVNDVCVAGAAPDGPMGGVDAPVGPTPDGAMTGTPPCGAMSLLQDDFTGGVAPWWFSYADQPNGGPSVAVSNGQAVVHLPAGSSTAGAGLGSMFYYDWSESQLEATVSQVGGTDTILEVRGLGGGKVQLVAENGSFYAGVFGNVASPGTRKQITYDPAQHRRWRLREHAGTTYWEWSPDGATWTELWHEADPFPPGVASARLSANGELGAVSEAHFDEVNLGAPVPSGFCAAATVTDDFNGGFAPLWLSWDDSNATARVSNGKAVLSIPALNLWPGFQTNKVYDLRSSTFYADVVSVPQVLGAVTSMNLLERGDGKQSLEFNQENNQLQILEKVGGSQVMSMTVTYDPVAQRYWRFAGAGGKVSFDVSPDGVTWSTLKTITPQIDLSAVLPVFGAGEYSQGTDPNPPAETMAFGSVNIP